MDGTIDIPRDTSYTRGLSRRGAGILGLRRLCMKIPMGFDGPILGVDPDGGPRIPLSPEFLAPISGWVPLKQLLAIAPDNSCVDSLLGYGATVRRRPRFFRDLLGPEDGA